MTDPAALPDADLLAEYVGWMRLGDAGHLRAELLRRLADRDRLRDALRAAWRVAADAVLAGASGTAWADLEESARAALAASGVTVGEQP